MIEWLILTSVVCYFIYRYFTKDYDYWEKQNVPFVKPYFLLGSFRFTKTPLQHIEKEFYDKYGRIYGRFDGTLPVLSVADPELLKRVLVKDFHIFQNHRSFKMNDPIMDNILFALEGKDWKRVRNIVSPVFTAAKLRKMMPLLEDSLDALLRNLEKAAQKNEDIHCQEHFGAFIMDAISKCVFSMNVNSLEGENEIFIDKVKTVFESFMSWRTAFTIICPKLMKLLRITMLNPDTMTFFKDIVDKLIEERKKNSNNTTKDFLQLLMEAEEAAQENNNGHSSEESASTLQQTQPVSDSSQGTIKGLTHDEFLAQCVVFFIAGYDPTTSLFSHIMYRLAVNQDYQKRLLEEIEQAMADHDGILNMDTLSELKYMEAMLNEALRLCPAIVRSDRRAEEDYVLGDTGILLKKDMLVSIPIYAIHKDPEWYPDPEEFRPERFFSPDVERPPYVHLPFGAGPRLCVGMRFAILEVKLSLAKILLRYSVHPSKETEIPLGYTETRNVFKVNKVVVKLLPRAASE